MLDALRIATKGWVGRTLMTIVMGFLILSFAIWGIGDIFRGFGADQLAQVGKVEIGLDEYRSAYQTELQRLQRQSRRAITNEEARQFGIDRQVLSRLVSEATLNQKVAELSLGMSDQEVAQKIAQEEAFKGATGKFDRPKFDAILREIGFTEQNFVREQRAHHLRQQITNSLVYGLDLPQALLAAIHRYQTESRTIETIAFPADHGGPVPAPSEDDLKAYFEAHRQAYATPEYRSLLILALTPEALAKPEEIADEEARKRYEDLKNERFGTPEKRAIEQILYTDAAAATAARASLDAGANWDKLLADQKLTSADTSLGTLPRKGIADQKVADAAFALEEGKVSAPIDTQFGTVLIKVTKIEPANIKPFESVSAEIKREIAVQRARGEVTRLHDAIEDERASGKPLDEAARSAGHEARVIAAIDAKGADPQGVPVADMLDAAALLKAAFASDIGVDNETLRLTGGGYQWFEVTKIEPAREKSFDEVRAEVEKAWRTDAAAKRLAAKTADLAKRLEAGDSMAAIASSEGGLEIKRLTGVKRGFNPEVAPNIAAQFFNVGVGGAGSVSQADGGRLLFEVVDSSVPPFENTDPSLDALSADIKSGMAEDVIAQYLTQLQNNLGVRINPKALAAATGASDNY